MSGNIFLLFALLISISIGCSHSAPSPNESISALSPQQSDTSSIDWKLFTWAEMERRVSEGRAVLLYCHPTYAVGDDYLLEEFEDPRLIRLYGEGKFVAMTLKYDDWEGEEIRTIFQRIGHTKYPMAILFRPDHEPLRIDVMNIDQWLEFIA